MEYDTGYDNGKIKPDNVKKTEYSDIVFFFWSKNILLSWHMSCILEVESKMYTLGHI